jgi:hypothetical protein
MVMMEVVAVVVVRKGPENGEEDLPWERYYISLDQYLDQYSGIAYIIAISWSVRIRAS